MIIRSALVRAARAPPICRRPAWRPAMAAILQHPAPGASASGRARAREQIRCFASSRDADTVMETLQDLYATAKDEFEIAAEETTKKSIYAPDDRAAASEALGTLKRAYEDAVRASDPETAKEVQRRVGDRVRELESAMRNVEEMGMED